MNVYIMSRPARALWIEISESLGSLYCLKSRPARALWIEIQQVNIFSRLKFVEAREGLVD